MIDFADGIWRESITLHETEEFVLSSVGSKRETTKNAWGGWRSSKAKEASISVVFFYNQSTTVVWVIWFCWSFSTMIFI